MSRRSDASIRRDIGGHLEGHKRGAHNTAEEHRRWRAANPEKQTASNKRYWAKKKEIERIRRAALAYVLAHDEELARLALAAAMGSKEDLGALSEPTSTPIPLLEVRSSMGEAPSLQQGRRQAQEEKAEEIVGKGNLANFGNKRAAPFGKGGKRKGGKKGKGK